MTALRCANGCFSAALKPSSRHVEIAKFSTPYNRTLYRQRNVIERTINRIKDWRRIATRYDRNVVVYLASLFIVATVTWWL
jgi:transposase